MGKEERDRATVPSLQQSSDLGDWFWGFWPLVPIYPYARRQTLRRELIPDTLWTFEQVQGIFYVVVPVRMTVVKLETGGLLVYAPVAPTPECKRLLRELEVQHGEVKYIILPTISGLEHKVFVGPFARCFPKARVYAAPQQWSFPIDLPLSWLGFPPERTEVLPEDSSQTPFADEFDYEILGPIDLGLRPFSEVVFFHKRSRSLLVTDTIVSIPEEPPEVVQLDPYPLLFHAREQARDRIEDSPQLRRKGWQRICLFTLYFRASVLDTIPLLKAFLLASTAPERSKKAYFGIYPFKWKENWQQSFAALRKSNLLVAPILQTLILNRGSKETLNWAKRIGRWNFERIVPCHFNAPIAADWQQFREAFAFLEGRTLLPRADFEVMEEIDDILVRTRIIPPAR